MRKTVVLHPFLLAAYFVIFLLANNVDQLETTQIIRPLLISLSFAGLLLLLFGFSTKNWDQAGLSVTLIIFLFFSYGHIYSVLEKAGSALANHIILGAIWLILLTAGMLLKWKIPGASAVTRVLNIVTAVLLIYPLFTIALFHIQSGGKIVVEEESLISTYQAEYSGNTPSSLPDIYYIIVDGFGRSDVLSEIYGVDNSEFIQSLKDRGFYVAEESRSNYTQTSLSLASSLNFNYLDGLAEAVNENSRDRDPLSDMIQQSEVRAFLEGNGYQTISFATGYGATELKDADLYIPYEPTVISELETMLLIGSMTIMLGDRMSGLFNPLICEVHRGGILNMFENMKDVPAVDGPKFVFAHTLSPHPPFVFTANGDPVKHGACNGFDGDIFDGNSEEYLTGYGEQVVYISSLLEETVDHILAESETPPIIIVQGDHGPGSMLTWKSAEDSCLHERTGILNAYYFPDGQDTLYESITPVNSFRVLFNQTFNTGLPLLEDNNYFSPWDAPYQFVQITEQIEDSCQNVP